MRCCDILAGLIVALGVSVAGCSKPASNEGGSPASRQSSPQAESTARAATKPSADALKSDTPEAAATTFLEALRTGNDRVAERMFTKLARERIKEIGIQVAPRGSDTAKFTIGKAEMLTEDGARVPCKWTDVDKNGHPHADDMTWMFSKQPEGWRVAGMAAVVFDGEDPILLDFENPKETMEKLKRLSEEVKKRTAGQIPEARQAENPKEDPRR